MAKVIYGWMVLLIWAAGLLGAQGATTAVVHVVRPGDTLEALAGHYLGSQYRWQEIWRVNQEIENPHLIEPGYRIRIPLKSRLPSNSVKVRSAGSRVEEQPRPLEWIGALRNDVLVVHDAIKTPRSQGAELELPDGATVVLSEDSLIFVRPHSRLKRHDRAEAIEIFEGQADLQSIQAEVKLDDFEIIVGPAHLEPKAAESGALRARARKPGKAEGAQLMVYDGEGRLAAGGETVNLTAGTGSVVPESGPPSPPEKLLPSPQLVRPTEGSQLRRNNPVFAWDLVPGASAYVLEICEDAQCAGLVKKVEQGSNIWQGEDLGMGSFFWRTTAVAASGLDGFPSEASVFSILSDQRGVAQQASINYSGTAFRLGTMLVLGPDGELIPHSGDGLQEEDWVLSLDGETKAMKEWNGAWTAGQHTATAVYLGGVSPQRVEFSFISDPVPPEMEWRVGSDNLLDHHGGMGQEGGKGEKFKGKRHREVPLEWSTDGIAWVPVLLRESEPGDEESRWKVLSDKPHLFFRTKKNKAFAVNAPVELKKDEILRIQAEDSESGVARMEVGVVDEGGLWYLEILAIDRVDNQSQVRWPLDR